MWLWLLCFLSLFSMHSFADTTLNEVEVIGKLDQERNSIVPNLGATQYYIGRQQIATQSEGPNASFTQVILRAPGVAQDSLGSGQMHIHGEHANVQYRINGVQLPEGIAGFGQELDSRFIDNVSLIDGSLPAQYGFRTAGIIDIHTKNGLFSNGGTVSMYGGSYNTVSPSFSYGGSNSKKDINYYLTTSYLKDDIGIENPTGSHSPIHDQTQQGKAFAYVSKIIDDTSRATLMLSGSHGDFQIPNNPGQRGTTTLAGFPTDANGNSIFDSSLLNERQTEQNYYGILTYQKSTDNLNYQMSIFNRDSEVLFRPDINGDLIFNGVASLVHNDIITNGFELDASYLCNEQHTLRTGALFNISRVQNENTSYVFPTDASGAQTSTRPIRIIDNHGKQGELYGIYLQDEWKPFEKLTINFGGRFDQSYAYLNENQFSPRANAVYTIDENTKIHVGYSRYFTPAPLELVQNPNVHIYDNTTNSFAVTQNDPVKAERAHHFDGGITHSFSPYLQVGLNGYYKLAKNQIDDGQFGSAIITTPFNYAKGRVYGTELTINYRKGDFASYANVAWSRALGKRWNSAQFHFAQDDINFVNDHWIHLDHDQTISASTGVSYTFYNTMVYADMLFGSGLRRSGTNGTPNNKRIGAYDPVNIGLEHTFKLNASRDIKVRFDVVNLFDEVYKLRDGTGVGVGAPQFGQRRGFYGGLTYDF